MKFNSLLEVNKVGKLRAFENISEFPPEDGKRKYHKRKPSVDPKLNAKRVKLNEDKVDDDMNNNNNLFTDKLNTKVNFQLRSYIKSIQDGILVHNYGPLTFIHLSPAPKERRSV